jgi:hypothetical protein
MPVWQIGHIPKRIASHLISNDIFRAHWSIAKSGLDPIPLLLILAMVDFSRLYNFSAITRDSASLTYLDMSYFCSMVSLLVINISNSSAAFLGKIKKI